MIATIRWRVCESRRDLSDQLPDSPENKENENDQCGERFASADEKTPMKFDEDVKES